MLTRLRSYLHARREQKRAWKARQWRLCLEASALEYRLSDLAQQITFTGGSTRDYFYWKRVERIRGRARLREIRRWRKYNYNYGHVRDERTYKRKDIA